MTEDFTKEGLASRRRKTGREECHEIKRVEFPVRRAGFREIKRTEYPLEFILVAGRAWVALPRVILVEWQRQKIDLSRVCRIISRTLLTPVDMG